MARPKLVAVLVALAGSGAFVHSQAQAPQAPPARPMFRAQVDYVEVDARVLDEKGNLVRDLTQDDFELLEDNRPQKIEVFRNITIPEQTEAAGFTRSAIDPDVVNSTASRETEGRLYVILLDDRQISPHRTQQTVTAAKKFIRENIGPRDLTAVVSSSGRTDISQNFTASKQLLLRAVDGFIGRKPESAVIAGGGAPPDPWTLNAPSETNLKTERYYEARAALQSVESICNWLGTVRGRSKALIYISEGLDYNYEDISDPWSELILAQQRDSIGAATRANVTIYPIDPRGLGQDDTILIGDNVVQPPATTNPFGAPPPVETVLAGGLEGPTTASRSAQMRAEIDRAHLTLRQIADDTGGFATINTNDPGKFFERIVTQSSSYYLLAYSPTNNRREGKFRAIRVRVKRPGLRVVARRGYIEAFDKKKDPPPLPAFSAASAETREILNGVWPVGDLPLTATAVAFRAASGNASVAVILESPADNLALMERDGKMTGTVEISTVAVDQASTITSGQNHKITFGLTPEVHERFKRKGFRTMSSLADLKPGRYQIRVAVVPENSSVRGSLWYDVEVPDFGKGDLALSGVLLSSVAEGQTPTGNPGKLFAGALTLPPTTVREFKLADELNVYAEIYDNQLSPPHQVDVTVTIRGDGDRIVFRSNDWASSEELNIGKGAYPSTTWIPLQELGGPGNYVLHVQAQRALDDTQPVSRTIPFKVVP
jgi:VWFA-related protein